MRKMFAGKLFIIASFLSLQFYYVQGEEEGLSLCCLHTRSNHCMQSCRRLVNLRKYSHISKRLLSMVATCPRSEIMFWDCLQGSKVWADFQRETVKKPHYQTRSHTVCCKEAKHISCEVQCLTTKDVNKLQNENCDAVREPKFSECVFKVQASHDCCNNAANLQCKDACFKYFKNSRSESILQNKKEVETKCGKKSKQFQCAMNQSDFKSVIQDFSKCCSRGTSKTCERTCRQALQNSADFKDIFATLGKDCGLFSIQAPIYKCILESASVVDPKEEEPEPQQLPLSERSSSVKKFTFKEQCCARAKSIQCNRWCLGTISRPASMGLWDTMYLSCIQNPKEAELSSCMSDVLEPCQMGGKSKLKFCSNLNDRPFELFRQMNDYGDGAAQKLFKFWSYGVVQVFDYQLIFKDISKCYPAKFKALACLLAVKPCSHSIPQRQVCRSDCVELLGSCLNRERTMMSITPIEKVCAAILPNDNQTNCISVKDYLTKPTPKVQDKVTLPCDGNPCKNGEVCMIDRSCDTKNPNCKPYKCTKGCRISGKSKLIIPVGQLAKLSVDEHDKVCYRICTCEDQLTSSSSDDSHTFFGNCREFGCHLKRKCAWKARTWDDGEVFLDGCNTCTCNDGKLLCSKKSCKKQTALQITDRSRRHQDWKNLASTLPCDCPSVYNPVCGVNGFTYPSFCLAKCGNMDDNQLYVGDCQAVDPCDPDPCTHGLTCTPKRNVCLSSKTHCPQYTCFVRDPPARHFESYSTCKSDDISKICGYDGVTYKNKCFADKAGTWTDYHGSCLPDLLKKSNEKVNRCEHVTCPQLKKSDCETIIPFGSCCPVCASVLRVLYSQQDLLNHQLYITYDPMTVTDVINSMRQLLRVVECSIHGHLTIEGDLMIILSINTAQPTKEQIHACNTEAERFNKYINNRSPMMTTNYYLSILKASKLEKAKWTTGSSSSRLFCRTRTNWVLTALTIFCFVLLR